MRLSLVATLTLPLLAGCASRLGGGIGSSHLSSMATDPCDPTNGSLAILSWTGGISILAGMACLVITRGSMGMRAAVGGVLLVLLNFAVNRYAHAIFIPMIVGTGLISLSWSYFQIKKVWMAKPTTVSSAAPTPVVFGKKRSKWSFLRGKK